MSVINKKEPSKLIDSTKENTNSQTKDPSSPEYEFKKEPSENSKSLKDNNLAAVNEVTPDGEEETQDQTAPSRRKDTLEFSGDNIFTTSNALIIIQDLFAAIGKVFTGIYELAQNTLSALKVDNFELELPSKKKDASAIDLQDKENSLDSKTQSNEQNPERRDNKEKNNRQDDLGTSPPEQITLEEGRDDDEISVVSGTQSLEQDTIEENTDKAPSTPPALANMPPEALKQAKKSGQGVHKEAKAAKTNGQEPSAKIQAPMANKSPMAK